MQFFDSQFKTLQGYNTSKIKEVRKSAWRFFSSFCMDFNLKSVPWLENLCHEFGNMYLDMGKKIKHVEDQFEKVTANVEGLYTAVVHDIIRHPLNMSEPAKLSNGDACAGADPLKDNPSNKESEKITSTGKIFPSISISNEICYGSAPSHISTGEAAAGIESSCNGNSSVAHKECGTDINGDNREDKMATPKFSKETSCGDAADEFGFCGFEATLKESYCSEMCQKSGKDGLEIPSHEKPPTPDYAKVAGSKEPLSQDLSCSSLLNENEVDEKPNENEEKVGGKLNENGERVKDKPKSVEEVHSSVSSGEGASNAARIDSPECLEREPSRVFLGDAAYNAALTDFPDGVADLVHSGLSYESKAEDSGLLPSSNISSTKKNDWSAELVTCNVSFEPVVNMNEFEDVKLGDSCMVVDLKEIPSIPSRARRPRSYKKKIRDVLASRSSKQREYEQLSILHSDLDAAVTEVRIEGSIPSMLTKHVVSTDDSCESDWELL
ncbi:hypothetical protein Sjap_026015 [Stephania japonica]|uniref:Uncharacterized protein n=1 Tax=Stephania japonica TaxID=461633 RepID=A0AAP0HG45_9MAGN